MRFLPSYLLTFLSVILCLALSSELRASNILFEYFDVGKTTQHQSFVLEEYHKHPLYLVPTLVRVNNHEELADRGDGVVYVKLPDTKQTVSFRFSSGFADNDGSSWYAETTDEEGNSDWYGSLHIVKTTDSPTIMGTINYGDALYEFMPVDKDHCLIYRVDTEQFTNSKECGTGDSRKHKKPRINIPSEEKSSTSPCGRGKVTILLLSSPAARAAIPANNFNYTVNTAVYQLKQSIANSYIDADNLEIATVSPVVSTNFVEGNSTTMDVDNLSNNFDGLRASNDADLVVMFTDGSLGDYSSTYGRAEAIGPNINSPYAIVQITAASTRKTFAHEVGHLLGGRHALDLGGTTEHGQPITACNPNRGTIMCLGFEFSGSSTNRVLNFSNPIGTRCGAPLGNSTSRDVASFIENNGQTVANFEPNTGNFDFVVWVSGPWSICPCKSAIFNANKRCASQNGAVSYQWHRSVNGGTYQAVGSGSSYNNSFSCNTPSGTNYVVRLTATDAANNVSISTKHGSVSTYACGGGWRVAPDTSPKNLSPSTLQVYPNPLASTDNTSLSLHLSSPLVNGMINVYNANLQIVYQEVINLKSREVNFSIDKKFNRGLHFITVTDFDTNEQFTSKLIIK